MSNFVCQRRLSEYISRGLFNQGQKEAPSSGTVKESPVHCGVMEEAAFGSRALTAAISQGPIVPVCMRTFLTHCTHVNCPHWKKQLSKWPLTESDTHATMSTRTLGTLEQDFHP